MTSESSGSWLWQGASVSLCDSRFGQNQAAVSLQSSSKGFFCNYLMWFSPWSEMKKSLSILVSLMQHSYCFSNTFHTWTTMSVTLIWTQCSRVGQMPFILQYVSAVWKVLTRLSLMVTSLCISQRHRLTKLWQRHKQTNSISTKQIPNRWITVEIGQQVAKYWTEIKHQQQKNAL